MSWSPGQYTKFEDERTRPARDLLAAVPGGAGCAVDLGCGPGNSTELLAARWPGARVSGVDSSPDMVAEARRRLPGLAFELADIAAWQPAGPCDVIFANAVLQWLPDHARLLPRLVQQLRPGGSLAVQMPDNLDQPSHTLMQQDGPWRARLEAVAGVRSAISSPSWYYGLLRPQCGRVDVWRTTYHHPLDGADGIVEWFKGSGLRPFLAALQADEREPYLQRYRAALAEAYPVQPDGTALLAFPRLFIVATR